MQNHTETKCRTQEGIDTHYSFSIRSGNWGYFGKEGNHHELFLFKTNGYLAIPRRDRFVPYLVSRDPDAPLGILPRVSS